MSNLAICIDDIIEQLSAVDQTKRVLIVMKNPMGMKMYCMPNSIISLRGSYCGPSLTFDTFSTHGIDSARLYEFIQFCCPTVSELLQVLEGAIAKDKSFTGYNGGEFTFSGYQLLRCENYGQYGQYREFTPAISGVIDIDHCDFIVLKTDLIEY